jgi:hypothetical protein
LTHRSSSRVSELVVTSTGASSAQSSAWEPVATLSTGLDGENANSNGVSTSSLHRRRSLASPRLRPTSVAERKGPRRRTAAGAVGRSRQEVADRSQVVLGHMPASSLGAGTGSRLRSSRHPGRRKTGRGPGFSRAHPSRLAQAAQRARAPTGRRSRVRPRSPGTGEGHGAGGEDLPAPRPIQQGPRPVLSNGLQSSSSRDDTR